MADVGAFYFAEGPWPFMLFVNSMITLLNTRFYQCGVPRIAVDIHGAKINTLLRVIRYDCPLADAMIRESGESPELCPLL